MKTKVAINGFGRIGRNVFKVLLDRDDVEIVAINDLTDTETLAHLLRFDTAYGQYAAEIAVGEGTMTVDGNQMQMVSQPDPEQLPWGDLSVDVVIECTGRFTSPTAAQAHVKAGAKAVVISAPAKGEGAEDALSVIIGVNDHDQLEQDLSGRIVSNASCTTNCVSPMVNVLESAFGIESAMMTTIHSYTADQRLQDGPHKDLRRARAAAENIVPTSTGAAIATTKIIPELENKFDGMAVRVPSITGSLTDLTAVLGRDVTIEEVNNAFKDAAEQPYYQGVLSVTDLPIVSSDIRGDSHSAIIDMQLTNVVGGRMVKVVGWYDNEWAYSNRLAELAADVGVNVGKSTTDSPKPKSDVAINVEPKSAAVSGPVVEPTPKASRKVISPVSDISAPKPMEDLIANDSQLNGSSATLTSENDTKEDVANHHEDIMEDKMPAANDIEQIDAAEPISSDQPEETVKTAESEVSVDSPVEAISSPADEALTDDAIIEDAATPSTESIGVDVPEIPKEFVTQAPAAEVSDLLNTDVMNALEAQSEESAVSEGKDETSSKDSIAPESETAQSEAGTNSAAWSSVNDSYDSFDTAKAQPTPAAKVEMPVEESEPSSGMLDEIADDMETVRSNEPIQTTDVPPTFSDIVKPRSISPSGSPEADQV